LLETNKILHYVAKYNDILVTMYIL